MIEIITRECGPSTIVDTLVQELEEIEYDIASYEYSMSVDKSKMNVEFCEAKIQELIERRKNLG